MFLNTFKLLSFLAFKLLIMKGSFCMPITEILERNAREFGNDVALVEVNPEIRETRRVTWKEYELIEPNPVCHYRREITWSVFNEKANRFANLLLSRLQARPRLRRCISCPRPPQIRQQPPHLSDQNNISFRQWSSSP